MEESIVKSAASPLLDNDNGLVKLIGLVSVLAETDIWLIDTTGRWFGSSVKVLSLASKRLVSTPPNVREAGTLFSW